MSQTKARRLPERGARADAWRSADGDMLNMDKINALPQPFMGVFLGGDRWPIYDIGVNTGTLRIDVIGLLQIKSFCELTALIDDTGTSHDPETFWTDYEEPTK